MVEAIINLARSTDFGTALTLIRQFTKADGTPADKAGDIAEHHYPKVMDEIAHLTANRVAKEPSVV